MEDENLELILITNDGPSIATSNYWDSEMAQTGILAVSYHAGSLRVLVPEVLAGQIPDMIKGGKEAWFILIKDYAGEDGEIVFQYVVQDGSDEPWSFCGGMHSILGALAVTKGTKLSSSIWTRSDGQIIKCWEAPAKLAEAEELPAV